MEASAYASSMMYIWSLEFSAGRLSGDIHEKLKVREPDEAVGEATSSECDLYDEEGGLKSADQAGWQSISERLHLD